MIRRLIRAASAAACALLVTGTALAQQAAPRAPLLIEGKKTLYQKVLTRPGAKVAAQIGGPATGAPLPPMSVLYVYARAGGQLEVGASSDGKTLGFLPEAETIPWRHTLVMGFASPVGRERTLFFRTYENLDSVVRAPQPPESVKPWRDAIARGPLQEDAPIVSIEPENTVDLEKQFYLLPILEAKTMMTAEGFKVRGVRVASVTKEAPAPGAGPTPNAGQRANADALQSFRSSVVFVVDATASMQPYIDRTRAAMTEVYGRLEAAKLTDKARFGLVAFRDDPQKVPGIEYLAKTFVDPNKAASRDDFMQAIANLKATSISTRAFAEDAYAGVEHAVKGLDWDPFGGRYLVMITDASAREGNDPNSSSHLSTDQVRRLVLDNKSAIYVLHLMTPAGKDNHAAAKSQYQRLSDYPGVSATGGSLYYPVESGDADQFKTVVTKLADMLVDQVRHTAEAGAKPAAPNAAAPGKDPNARLAQATDAVGHAMRLAWLGRTTNTPAPTLFEAWASDRDFGHKDVATFTVRLLMSKNQLSDLQATLRKIVDAGERSQLDPGDFFNQLRSAAVAMGRDPSQIGGKARNLEQAGLMGEYLEGLPYQSKLMALDEDTWSRMGVGEQQAVIDEIKSKIALYQRYHDDVDRWVKLHPSAAAGDAVFPVPLDALP